MTTSTKDGASIKPAMPSAKPRIVYGEQLGALEEAIQKAIAYRAYEMFESKGRTHGHHMEDWFDAERDLIRPANIEITDGPNGIALRAGVPGFQAENVQIGVSPRKIIIWGRVSSAGTTPRRKMPQMLAEIELPSAIDAKHARAVMNNEVLDFAAPKQLPRSS
ncbi:MAG: DUF2934 domain-containing protein [Terriglobia bacterium]